MEVRPGADPHDSDRAVTLRLAKIGDGLAGETHLVRDPPYGEIQETSRAGKVRGRLRCAHLGEDARVDERLVRGDVLNLDETVQILPSAGEVRLTARRHR